MSANRLPTVSASFYLDLTTTWGHTRHLLDGELRYLPRGAPVTIHVGDTHYHDPQVEGWTLERLAELVVARTLQVEIAGQPTTVKAWTRALVEQIAVQVEAESR